VDLYTRGLSPAVRAARRDEILDDLWCQHDEATAIGRSPRSLAGEILLRLFFGMPADLSWRLSNRSSAERTDLERSSSMSVRVLAIFAIIAGASWTVWVLLFLALGESAWAGSAGPLMGLLYIGGALVLVLAALGLVWRFQELLRPAATFGAVALVIGAIVPFPANPLSVLLPAGSVLLVWDLARIGVLSRGVAIVHVVSGVGLLVGFIGIIIGLPALGIAFALAIPYLPSWIAIGMSLLLRSVPRSLHSAA
jgi:hypothetical protein